MGLFNQFPFTNFHEMNLDWLLNEMLSLKKLIANNKNWYSGVNVKDFGAVGDGVTDDTKAFSDAFNTASNTSKMLIIPPGKYYAISFPNFAVNDMTVTGIGECELIYGGTENALNLNGNGATNVTIENLIIKCPSTAKNAVYVGMMHHSILRDITIAGCGAGYDGFVVDNCVCTLIENLKISNNSSHSWYGAKPTHGVTVEPSNGIAGIGGYLLFINPIIEGCENGFNLINGSLGTIILGGTSEGHSGFGIIDDGDYTKIIATDFEANGTDFKTTVGKYGSYIAIDSEKMDFGGYAYRFISCSFNTVNCHGSSNVFDNCVFSKQGGDVTLADTNIINNCVYPNLGYLCGRVPQKIGDFVDSTFKNLKQNFVTVKTSTTCTVTMPNNDPAFTVDANDVINLPYQASISGSFSAWII